jgi:hypothetical protein
MAGFGFAGAAAGAGDALHQMLVEQRAKFLQDEALKQQQAQAQQQAAQFAQQMAAQSEGRALQTRQFEANEADRTAQRERQGRLDDVAAGVRRQDQNAVGVRRMIGDFLVQRGAQPLDAGSRQTLQGMALQEGVEVPSSVTADPTAGLADYEAKKKIDLKYRPPSGGGAPQQQWVIRGGQPVPIPAGTAQAGDRPYDPVAARSSQPENKAEAEDTAREVTRLASSLRNSKGFSGVFGKYSAATPNLLSSQDTVDARTTLNSLKGLLTLENMGKMKGVLSDSDMRILQQASTTLAAEMSEEAAAQELDRLVAVMGRVSRGAPTVDATPTDTEFDWVNGQLVPRGGAK